MSSQLSPFTKMQAIGNDFVVVDRTLWPEETDWSAAAIRLCDRHYGIGSDGLMLFGPSESADLRMQMFNPDGTEDMCGNGMRCVLQLAFQQGKIPPKGTIQTITGNRAFEFTPSGTITTEMGAPRFHPDMLPMRITAEQVLNYPLAVGEETLPVSVVSTGSLHTILFVEQLPEDRRFFHLSPLLEHHEVFPERTSVMWTEVESPDRLRLRIWERAVGETMGCGTGASAAVVAAIVTGRARSGDWVKVVSRGGVLGVKWQGGGEPVYLNGSASVVFSGRTT